MIATRLATITVAGVAAAPVRAFACAVCFVGREDSMAAYYGTALLLTVLPLALFGGLGFWLRRKLRAAPQAIDPLDAPRA